MINPTVTKLRNKVAELETQVKECHHRLNEYRADNDKVEQINTELQAHLSDVVKDRDKLSDELIKAKSLNEMLSGEIKSLKSTAALKEKDYKSELTSKNNIAALFEHGMRANAARFKWFFLIGLIFGAMAGLSISLCF